MRFRLRYFTHIESFLTVGVDRKLPRESFGVEFGFWNQEVAPPLAKALLSIDGIVVVGFAPFEICLQKAPPFSWDDLVPHIRNVIHFHLAPDAPMTEVGKPLYRYVNGSNNLVRESERIQDRDYNLYERPPIVPFVFQDK